MWLDANLLRVFLLCIMLCFILDMFMRGSKIGCWTGSTTVLMSIEGLSRGVACFLGFWCLAGRIIWRIRWSFRSLGCPVSSTMLWTRQCILTTEGSEISIKSQESFN